MKAGILFLLIVGTLISLLILLVGGVSITIPKADKLIIIGTIAFFVLSIVIILRKWGYKLKLPVQEASAVVVEMRTETEEYSTVPGRATPTGLGKYKLQTKLGQSVLIGHCAVFEFDTGERIELKVKARDVSILREGMRGTLTYRQGWMKGFKPS